MTQITFGRDRNRSRNDSFGKEFDGPITSTLVESRIAKLASVLQQKTNLCCLVFGDGGMPHGSYHKLSALDGVDVLSFGSYLPAPLFLLRRLIASEYGLVRIKDISKLPYVFEKLTSQSMALIFVVPHEYAPVLIKKIIARKKFSSFDFDARQSDKHLIYLIDADSSESDTGIMQYFSCGSECDKDIASIFDQQTTNY